MFNHFDELRQFIASLPDDKKGCLTVWEDEGIVRVQVPDPNDEDEEILIFRAEAVNFVHAFFRVLGVIVEDTISLYPLWKEEVDYDEEVL